MLTEQEIYAIARATAGLSWQETFVDPTIRLLLNNLQLKDATPLLRLLGPELSSRVLQTDVNALPPPVVQKTPEPAPVVVPVLPRQARLTDRALKAAEGAGRWLDDALIWVSRRSPMTPSCFLTAGLVWALGLAIARRCAAPLHKPIYPHLYVLWVATTSLFKKTTGMEAIYDLVSAAMPHMLLPEENTPEAFITALGGRRPPNYEELSAYEKQLEDQGRRFAAQRGLLLDEASSLFGASRKDYMQGHAEMIMRLYDAPHRYTRNVRSEGKIVVYDASLCILGATTPALLARTTNAQSWETGELARYALLFPEQAMPYDAGGHLDDFTPPPDLVKRLMALHNTLPTPPDPLLFSTEKPPQREVLSAHIAKDAYAAYDAYTKAVTYDLLREKAPPDARLHPNYARLHVQAVKVALTLAAIDWADGGSKGLLHLTLGHWARAQQVTETWRASYHRLMDALNRGDDSQTETRLLDTLITTSNALTLRELTQCTGLRRKAIEEALRSLVDAGLVSVERRRRGERGPEATLFRAVSENP